MLQQQPDQQQLRARVRALAGATCQYCVRLTQSAAHRLVRIALSSCTLARLMLCVASTASAYSFSICSLCGADLFRSGRREGEARLTGIKTASVRPAYGQAERQQCELQYGWLQASSGGGAAACLQVRRACLPGGKPAPKQASIAAAAPPAACLRHDGSAEHLVERGNLPHRPLGVLYLQ